MLLNQSTIKTFTKDKNPWEMGGLYIQIKNEINCKHFIFCITSTDAVVEYPLLAWRAFLHSDRSKITAIDLPHHSP